MQYEVVIGLEVHVQLSTRTKIFCCCPNEFGGEPNSRICPICLGYPGTLPVLNRAVVDQAVRLGLAIGCRIHKRSVFSRKNYFYADSPKGYQITQFDLPLATDGQLPLPSGGSVHIARMHIEEDPAKLLHEAPGGVALQGQTLVDHNRSGVPLVEIVTEPVLRSAQQAQDYLHTLHQVLRYTETSDGNMEEGSLRCDVNVSLRPVGTEQLGTKVEVKNINSFRNVARAIAHEVDRQSLVLDSGQEVEQETRSFDAGSGTTRTLRGKEEAHDYRYFPEPDLPPLVLAEERVEAVRRSMPELPWARVERLCNVIGVRRDLAEQLAAHKELADYYEATYAACTDVEPIVVANWVLTEVLREVKVRDGGIEHAIAPATLAELVQLVAGDELSNAAGKEVLAAIWESGEAPRVAMERLGLVQVRDVGQLEQWIASVIEANPGPVGQLRAGELKVTGFLLGQVMKASGGRADPKLARERLLEAVGTE